MLIKVTSVLFFAIIFGELRFANSRRVKRVVGGMEVPCGVQREVASLRNATAKHLCGAVILTQTIALTAAHCVLHPEATYSLFLNNYCVSDHTDVPRAEVKQIILHPLYDEGAFARNGIAVICVRNRHAAMFVSVFSVPWYMVIVQRRLHLPITSMNEMLSDCGGCVIYGYGYYDLNRRVSETLRAANLELMSLDKCTEVLGKYVAPEPNSGMLCASGDGADACQGDSGGALICAGKLQGLSSYGIICSMEGLPGVYTSVGSHLQWIMGFLDRDEK